MKYKVKVRLVS